MAVETAQKSQLPGVEDSTLFINRELSFLEFNQRIVEEAADPSVPLLERVKFIAIVGANLDEFFMVRVAGLKQQLKSGVLETGPDRMLPREQLAAIAQRVRQQVEDSERILVEALLPALRAEGILLSKVAELTKGARKELEGRFAQDIFPMLTPVAVDPGHPFPFLKNRTLNLAVHLLPEESSASALPLLAIVQVPGQLPRFLQIDGAEQLTVVLIEDVIREHVGALFPGMRILECVPFRVVRNWDLSFDEDEQEDLLEAVENELRRRARLDAVRLEIGAQASRELREELRLSLSLEPTDLQPHNGPLAPVDLEQLVNRVGRSDLRDEPFQPVISTDLKEAESIFAEVAKGDLLLHHPYESYEPVIQLLAQAASDPTVLAIKQTLYRVTRDSPIVKSLVIAAQNGKQVTALVELKARFDEEANVEWARALEEAGVHVVYGMIGLKTHCKVTLIVRRETDGIRRYVHLGTGNYNERTARIYSDLSLFTSNEAVTTDVSSFFNLLTGYSNPPAWKKLIVAPLDLRRRLIDKIDAARAAAKKGTPAKVILKSNALIDAEVIRALCRAASQGVEVVLLIRGPCALRPGLAGVSKGIVVRMIIDRFLEHSRLFYFSIGDVEEVFITSTDIMPRNFDRRVELMLPVEDPKIKDRLINEILKTELADTVKASTLESDGTYRRVKQKAKAVRAQVAFIENARRRAGELGAQKKKKKKKDWVPKAKAKKSRVKAKKP